MNKEEIAIKQLQDYCPKDGYYLAFSGGKDSCVVKELLNRAGVPYEAVYRVTSVDPPELVRFIKDKHPDVAREVPRDENGKPVTMWNLIPRKGMPPTFRARYCCAELKETGGDGRFTVTGVRWEESVRRRRNHGTVDIRKGKGLEFLKDIEGIEERERGFVLVNDNDESRRTIEHCIKRAKVMINPIVSWSSSDVWGYIIKNKISYCELYEQGFDRLGCIGCPLICSEKRKMEFDRWPKYKEAYILAFGKLMEKLKQQGKLENSKFGTSAETMFRWWLKE